MPYFGRITLARVLAEVRQEGETLSGAALIEALDRLARAGRMLGRRPDRRAGCALAGRSYAQAIAWWGARLAEALEHAHDRGVLHRDIKPSNVLVIDDGMPMLLDFNLARESVLADDEMSRAEATLGGTVDYMAPEHLESLAEGLSDRVDRRSDIYGLGVLLYEAVVGKKPFLPPRKGHSVIDSLLRAADERRSDPGKSSLPATLGIPAPLAAVIRRCLEPEPDDRYQTAAELAADLRAVADDLPLVHAREPLFSRISRRLRRNRRRLARPDRLHGRSRGPGCLRQLPVRTIRAVRRGPRPVHGQAVPPQSTTANFEEAQIWLTTPPSGPTTPSSASLRNLLKWRDVLGLRRQAAAEARSALDQPGVWRISKTTSDSRPRCARMIVIARDQADNLLEESESPPVPADRPGRRPARRGQRAQAAARSVLRAQFEGGLDQARVYLGICWTRTRQRDFATRSTSCSSSGWSGIETCSPQTRRAAAAAGIASDPAALKQATRRLRPGPDLRRAQGPLAGAAGSAGRATWPGPARDGIGPAARTVPH